MLTFFYMMVHYPTIMAKAQAEIDGVIGSVPERLPTLEDRKNLPYIGCLLKELYRYLLNTSKFTCMIDYPMVASILLHPWVSQLTFLVCFFCTCLNASSRL